MMSHPEGFDGAWHRRHAVVALAAAAASAFVGRAHARFGGPTYSVMVVPQVPASELMRDWTPLLARLSQLTGCTLVLKLAASIPLFETELLAGVPDFAFLNPYHQVLAFRAQGYVPLVRNAQPLSGILVVRKDDPIQHVRELDGKEVAFPAPNALGASLYLRALLAEREKVHVRPVYVQTHSNVYRQVMLGKSAAGGGVNQTLAQERDELRNGLRVLLETPGVAPHPFSAHPRVPADLQEAVGAALLGLGADAAAAALLKAVQMPRPMRADHRRDYQPLEAMRLDRYVERETPSGGP